MLYIFQLWQYDCCDLKHSIIQEAVFPLFLPEWQNAALGLAAFQVGTSNMSKLCRSFENSDFKTSKSHLMIWMQYIVAKTSSSTDIPLWWISSLKVFMGGNPRDILQKKHFVSELTHTFKERCSFFVANYLFPNGKNVGNAF